MPNLLPASALRARPTYLLVLALALAFALLDTVAPLRAVRAADDPPAAATPAGPVWRVSLRSVVHPVAAGYLQRTLTEAAAAGAQLVVVELDTPGGLGASMQEMTTAIVTSEVPVVVYVSPRGAHAASAGFFLLMAADVAAMAPDTTTGAAAAIASEGGELPETLKRKVEEDSRAKIRAFASARGRNVELAEAAIVEARSFSAREALEQKLVEIVALDFEDLLRQLDGRKVERQGRPTLVLATRGAPVEGRTMTLFERILAVLADPNIALLLLSLGSAGLLVELYNPGSILPGVLGAIFIVLAFFGMSVLPVNVAGVALILLATLFFIAEIKVVSYGLLTVAGTVCLVLGGMMLVKTAEPALQVSGSVLAGVAIGSLLLAGSLAYLSLQSQRRPIATGREALVGQRGEARGAIAPRGKVFVRGELWNAESAVPIAAGEAVEIVAVEGLLLHVRPATEREPAA
jgi:membrane-bound serine protease (ClpP class)